MKHSGNVSDFIAHRDQEVYNAYKEILRSGNSPRRALDLYEKVASRPSPRLWVNEYRAAAVIGALRRERKRQLIKERAAGGLLNPPTEGERAQAKRAMMQRHVTEGTIPDNPIKKYTPSALEKMYTENNDNLRNSNNGNKDNLRKSSCLEKMYTEKRKMYELIYGRVERIMARDERKSLIEAVSEAVLTPADRFYLSPKTIGAIILRMRRQNRLKV